MTRTLITAAVVLGTATSAFALTDLDRDGDAMVTMEEVTAAYPSFTEAQFSDADTDGDGMLTEAEVTAARAVGIIPEEESDKG